MAANKKTLRIGCCITPHGFGHAARAAAVIEAVGCRVDAEFVLVTTVPKWFFTDSLTCTFNYRPMVTDIGLVQSSSLQEDLPATIKALDDFYPLSAERVAQTVELFSGCDLILCDVSPLGIMAARKLGVDSVLLENFTWDWIYKGYLEMHPGLQHHVEYLQGLYAQATHHLQAVPVCSRQSGVQQIPPISRLVRTSRTDIRRQLEVRENDKLVLITMGGVSGDVHAFGSFREIKDVVFVLGGCDHQVAEGKNIRCIPKKSKFYHSDLVAAADVVVGKAGYSTLAEVYNADVAFGYILRDTFRESSVLSDFIEEHMAGMEIQATELQDGTWVQYLDALTGQKTAAGRRENGAITAARIIADISNGI